MKLLVRAVFFIALCLLFSINTSCKKPCWICTYHSNSSIQSFDTCDKEIMQHWEDQVGWKCRRKW
jgi:hypothetical protein